LPFGASLRQESLRHLLRGHTREQSDHTFQLYLLRQIPPSPVAALKSAAAWLIATCLAALFSALTDHSSFGCTYPSSWPLAHHFLHSLHHVMRLFARLLLAHHPHHSV